MNAEEIRTILSENRLRLADYDVKALYLFGSVVRGEAGPESDVDILVEFEPTAHIGLFEFSRLQRHAVGNAAKIRRFGHSRRTAQSLERPNHE